MIRVLKSIVFLFLVSSTVFPQAAVLDSILYDDAETRLENGLYEMQRRNEAIAYNIANGTTPGFKPIRFQDEIDEHMRLYGTTELLDQVNIDDEMVKSTTIRLRHQAYIRLLSTKMGITKRIVSLGKGG